MWRTLFRGHLRSGADEHTFTILKQSRTTSPPRSGSNQPSGTENIMDTKGVIGTEFVGQGLSVL
eukprot:6417036-Prymnesium_polylepis.1